MEFLVERDASGRLGFETYWLSSPRQLIEHLYASISFCIKRTLQFHKIHGVDVRINDNVSEGIVLASGTKGAINHYYCYYYYQGEDEGIENKN